jgi:hypothetical protein
VAKTRVTIPKAVQEAVLKEFSHRCAICGRDRPQLHHIDRNPANNVVGNILPLCPNHHLLDAHAPTSALEEGILRLFRKHKDPFILHARFQPLWKRLRFLRIKKGEHAIGWKFCCNDLKEFVRSFQMGQYYAERIASVLAYPANHMIAHLREQGESITVKELAASSREQEFYDFRADEIESLCVEMLRYQDWPKEEVL